MSKRSTVVNFIGGPGVGKTTISALTFALLKCNNKLKEKHVVVEYVQELAKNLVWTKKWDALNDQHYVSRKQYELLKQIDGEVDIIVCDYSLLHGLYYNQYNPDNVSNIDKTNAAVMKWYGEFHNINIFLNRGAFEYEKSGRYQTEDQASQVGIDMKKILANNSIGYTEFI